MWSRKDRAKLMGMAGVVALMGMFPAGTVSAQTEEVAADGTPINVQSMALNAVTTTEPAVVDNAVEFGNPPDVGSGNCFPFGCNYAGPSTRYQQVYNKSFFSEPVLIDKIGFFATYHPGNFAAANYEIRLSTTTKAVNGLDTANLSNNVGSNDTLFYSANLSGSTGSVITFDGVDFPYDPSKGNLLIDIKVTNRQQYSGMSFFDARNGSFGTASSRAHDFGSGYSSYGLRTRFYTIPYNHPPVADAGPNQSAIQREEVCFDGSGSSDADNDPLTYSWTLTSWPAGSAVELDNPTSDKPCFMSDLPGTYKVSLIVNDGTVDSVPSTAEASVISYQQAINQLCPCSGPKGTSDKWKNHGQYVSCVSHSAEHFLEIGLITQAEKDAVCSEAGQSICGSKK